jgi:serine protease AprX
MKYYLLFLFSSVTLFAQTEAERKKIADTYDKAFVQELLNESATAFSFQQQAIAEYKAKYGFVDSEKKTLHRIEDGLPIFYTTFNQGSSASIAANKLYPGGSLGLSVTGAGMTAGIWDGGKVRDTHIEFGGGKIILSDDASNLSPHATHVTGTVVATGLSQIRKGIAYGAQAQTYDWNNDYNEMVAFGAAGFLVSNHSYGYNTEDLPVYKFGSYDASSIEIDNVSNASPYYQVVLAAGNDRNNFNLDHVSGLGGYDMLSGTGTSKNGLVVAAVEQVDNYIDASSVIMSDFSNFGPPDDGRIKPDVAAKGVNVTSTVSSTNTSYDIFSGTSMAAPAITGSIVLLQKHYNNLNASYMRASTVRGLICHTAKEAGLFPGPDYEFGWGLADIAGAATVITNKGVTSIIEENTLLNGGIDTKQFATTSTQDITVSICWTDPTGSSNGTAEDNRVPRLKNNLDLKILKDGTTYYPWKLTYEDFYAAATNDSDNDVDNIEKIQIPNAEPGVYTIQVTHKGTLTGNGATQVYSLIASGSAALATNGADFNDSIVLYPNPVKNTLSFAVPNNGEVTNVAIFDILGKQVKGTSALVNNNIDLSELAGGIYLARFTYNGTSFTKKFIKE